MTHDGPQVTGGVDTHGLTHHAAVIDPLGRHLADREFPATVAGYRDLPAWMRSHGALAAVGVEGTGAYGAELARVLTAAGTTIVDVDHPDRKVRRLRGESDPIDAYAAATAVASGRSRRRSQGPRRHGRSRARAAGGPPQRGQGPNPGDEPDPRPARVRPRSPA
ncbi:transposase [Kitasatospora cineracea]|uniref:IS110 family transposase n=1 Tax=Kitasatospora cineracea TaxID=88074 RepID=UPI00381F24EF